MSDPIYNQHIVIENVTPSVDGGRFPAKRIAGQVCPVEADIYRDGHDVIRAVVRYRRASDGEFSETPMVFLDNDRWQGAFTPGENARYVFSVQAWTDAFATWLADLRKRVEAGQQVASEAAEGAAIIKRASARAKGADAELLSTVLKNLESAKDHWASLKAVADGKLGDAMTRLQERADAVSIEPLTLIVDRSRAEFGAWYEFFVRSQGTDKSKSGTFSDAERRLSDVKQMGFDVLYLPPIHPIGRTARKGPNNSLVASATDPGCPWAIGNETGGHTAIEPSLGTLADFDRFVAKARSAGLEIALDFAVQCSPDHPWVKAHPEWFYRRPDGTIKFAENPPKKYEDIYPLNFDSPEAGALWQELKSVVDFWIGHGVKIFRVDNPHTKPTAFWKWLIHSVQEKNPDVLFLAEAFTRPKVMKMLAKAGFTQSYTYFTWRNEKKELIEYVTELATTDMADYYRPNFFANTPDILHEFLQKGGRPAFMIRAALAATLSPTWGIYSGFELCEGTPLHEGSEEYLDSEKFEVRPRDWSAPGNIRDFIGRLNVARNENAAFLKLGNIVFADIKNEQMIAFARFNEDKTNVVIVVVNLDPKKSQDAWLRLPLDKMGLPWNSKFDVRDLLTGQKFTWEENNWVRLDPATTPAHILRVERRVS